MIFTFLLLLTLSVVPESFAATSRAAIVLDYSQTQAFRSWVTRIIAEQIRRGPSPKWEHRDCAGLVRFAVLEALKTHDAEWLRSNGVGNADLPPEVALHETQKGLLGSWKQVGEDRFAAYAPAIGIVQENSVFVSRDLNQAQAGDLLFYDQGQEQHLMVWMGSYIAYHTGTSTREDSGLRAASVHDLMNWKDPRWQPRPDNPNFIGIYRFSFLSR